MSSAKSIKSLFARHEVVLVLVIVLVKASAKK